MTTVFTCMLVEQTPHLHTLLEPVCIICIFMSKPPQKQAG